MKRQSRIYSFCLLVFLISIIAVSCDNPSGSGGSSGSGDGETTYTLTTNAPNGTITTADPAGTVTSGNPSSVTATPDNGYIFVNWTSSDPNLSLLDPENPSTTVTLTGDATITANFIRVVFVDANFTGGDGDGFSLTPFTDIASGIENAHNLGVNRVYVATGIYDVTETIEMAEGVSLYGGYHNDNGSWSRYPYQTESDRATDLTQVTYTGADGGNYSSLASTIKALSTITNSTKIEGFTVKGKGCRASAAIYCAEGSPSITFNTINGGCSGDYGLLISGSSSLISYNTITVEEDPATTEYCINISNSSSTITHNKIGGRTGEILTVGISTSGFQNLIENNSISNVYTGIKINDPASTNLNPQLIIQNNTILALECGIDSQNNRNRPTNVIISQNNITGRIGIYTGYYSSTIINNIINADIGDIFASAGIVDQNTDSTPSTISNNTINGGRGDLSYGIKSSAISPPLIYNNIIFTLPNSANNNTRYGVYYNCPIQNNNISNCPSGLYYGIAIGGATSDLSVINAIDGCSGNISVDPGFADPANGDYRLTGSSPTSVTQGGLDLSGEGITDDIEGNPRTGSWSIGAYEYD